MEREKDNCAPALAKNMFVITVRGLFIRLNFPYAQFPCVSMSGNQLFDLVWEAVYRLEMIQLKVLALITADGASSNCLFFKLHNPNAYPDNIQCVQHT